MAFPRIFSLLAVLFLAACACPHSGHHDDTPYGAQAEQHEARTAGAGAGKDGWYCLNKILPDRR